MNNNVFHSKISQEILGLYLFSVLREFQPFRRFSSSMAGKITQNLSKILTFYARRQLKTLNIYLGFLCEHPNDSFYSSQIAQKTNLSVGGVNQSLRLLTKHGLLKTEQRGRMVFYQVDTSSSIIRQFKVFRTILLLNPLVKKLQLLAEKVTLFGSCAEGTNTEDSDIDLLVVSSLKDEVGDIFSKFKNKRTIQLILKTPQEYVSLEKKEPTFYAEIEKGTPLWQKV